LQIFLPGHSWHRVLTSLIEAGAQGIYWAITPWSRHDEAKLLVGTRGSVAIISGYLVDACVGGWEAAGAAISLSTHNLRLIACSCGCSASRSSVRAVFGGPLPLPRIFAIWGVNRLDSAVCPIRPAAALYLARCATGA